METIQEIIKQVDKLPITIADEIVDYYRALSRDIVKNNPDILESINQWSDALEVTNDKDNIQLRINYCKVYYYRVNGDGENVFRYGLQAVHDNPMPHNIIYVAWIHRLISAMSFALGLIDQATEHANKALQLFLSLENNAEIIRSYIQLGIAYDFTENYELQLEYFNKAYELAKKIDAENIMLIALNNTIFVHILRGEFDKASVKLLELQSALEENDQSRLAIGAKLNAVHIALHEADLERANTLLDQVATFKLLETDLSMSLDCILLRGRYYFQLGDFDKSNTSFQSGYQKALDAQSKKYQLEFLSELANLNKTWSNYQEALKNQEDYINITKAISHEHASFHYLFLRVQYEIDQINDEVNLLKNQLSETQESTIFTLATLAEYKDQITGKHILRTMAYVEAFCHLINDQQIFEQTFSKAYIDNFSRSSALHDIGKVGISETILKKPGKLTSEEFDIIKQHTTLGRDALAITETIMSKGSFLKLAEMIAYTHHEKWDGSGYPMGLKEDEIPLEGRIVAIIDVYDALVSKRPYKPPYAHRKALAILKKERGRHFDPVLLDLFLDNHLIFFEIAKRLLDSEDEKKILAM